MYLVSRKDMLLMATSSIQKTFIIDGELQAEIFANAIDQASTQLPFKCNVPYEQIKGKTELDEFITMRNNIYD